MKKIYVYTEHSSYEGNLHEYATIEEAMNEYNSLHKYAMVVKFIEGEELELTAMSKKRGGDKK